MARDNPYRNLSAYSQVTIGGQRIKAALIAIDGNELVAEWMVQKATAVSGAIAVFRGINLIEGVKLTFECGTGDGTTAEEDYDDLSALKDKLMPAPRRTLNGPKPPTLRLENAVLNRMGLTDVCFKAWREYVTETNSWRVDFTLIQYAPPRPIGAGAQDPAVPLGFAVDPQILALRAERDRLVQQAAAL